MQEKVDGWLVIITEQCRRPDMKKNAQEVKIINESLSHINQIFAKQKLSMEKL